MSIASNILPTIKKTINDFGSTISINKYTQSYVNGKMQDVLSLAIPAKAIPEGYKSEEIMGTVQVGDSKFLIAYNDFSIDMASDKISFMGDEYEIINSVPLVFQDIIMVYEVHVRK